MTDSALAIISTLGWIALVGVILALFGRVEGGAWSIASGVARGVRGWSGGLRREPRVVSSSSTATLASSPTPEVDDLGELPVVRR